VARSATDVSSVCPEDRSDGDDQAAEHGGDDDDDGPAGVPAPWQLTRESNRLGAVVAPLLEWSVPPE
jgi:hypothetical protein